MIGMKTLIHTFLCIWRHQGSTLEDAFMCYDGNENKYRKFSWIFFSVNKYEEILYYFLS